MEFFQNFAQNQIKEYSAVFEWRYIFKIHILQGFLKAQG